MAHFAELNESNVVLRITVVANEVLLDENNIEQESLGLKHLEDLGGKWVQTSYNNSFRKNYAGIGFSYSPILDAFIPPKPYPSWILNEDTCKWESPVPLPEIKADIDEQYDWDENTTSWILHTIT